MRERQAKRKAEKTQRGLGKVDDLMLIRYNEIRSQFISDLFEQEGISYADLFSYYDHKWRRVARSFRSKMKKANKTRLKIISNLEAFTQEFKPLEAI